MTSHYHHLSSQAAEDAISMLPGAEKGSSLKLEERVDKVLGILERARKLSEEIRRYIKY